MNLSQAYAAKSSHHWGGREAPGRGIFVGSIRRSVGSTLLYMVMLEASVFGSGRILEIGPFTIKMVLFSLTLVYAMWGLLSLERVRFSTWLITISFVCLLFLGTANGLVNSADPQLVAGDISPLLSFLALPFFELTIRTKREISALIRIFISAALVMALVYIAVIGALLLRVVSFQTLYQWVTANGGDDFVFEGETGRVFYKGVIFICIAIILLIFQNNRRSKVLAALLLVALFVIGSRGLFSALALCALLYALIGPMSALKKVVVTGVVVLITSISLPVLFSMAGDKTESNTIRLTTISQVMESTTPASLLIGHGFGIGVPERPAHMEISYLEIFQKQGAVGLLWWATLFAIMAYRLRKALALGNKSLAYGLFLSSAFIAFESATNPFLNNPIGMYPFIFALVGLGILGDPLRVESA